MVISYIGGGISSTVVPLL